MAKKDPEVEFENVTKAQLIDDDGYEEGKSKEREMTANAATTDNKKTLNVIRQSGNKAGSFKSVSDLLKRPAKIIQIDGSKKKE